MALMTKYTWVFEVWGIFLGFYLNYLSNKKIFLLYLLYFAATFKNFEVFFQNFSRFFWNFEVFFWNFARFFRNNIVFFRNFEINSEEKLIYSELIFSMNYTSSVVCVLCCVSICVLSSFNSLSILLITVSWPVSFAVSLYYCIH